MVLHSDFRIIGFGGWSGHQRQGGAFTCPCPSLCNQLSADALVLICNIYRQIGKVAAVSEIGDSARDADQSFPVTRRYNNISMTQHPFQPFQVIDRTTLCQRRGNKDVAKFLC